MHEGRRDMVNYEKPQKTNETMNFRQNFKSDAYKLLKIGTIIIDENLRISFRLDFRFVRYLVFDHAVTRFLSQMKKNTSPIEETVIHPRKYPSFNKQPALISVDYRRRLENSTFICLFIVQ